MIDSIGFDSVIGLVIVINSAMMGIEVTQKLTGEVTLPFSSLELLFTSIYIIELVLRLYAHGLKRVAIPIGAKYDEFKRLQYPYLSLIHI